ncbi:MAG: deoxyribonuclease IV, partial [Pirellulaceae bacterium]|nr:deoxyribonuclease IV [Pirellulaceae bacterium]
TKNNSQWRGKPITDDQATIFKSASSDLQINHPISHASYLINMASPKDELRKKSMDAMAIELQRACQLGIPYVVVHPGSFTTSDESTGINAIRQSINQIHAQLPDLETQILLENTAGQGTNLGWQFEQLEQMIHGLNEPNRVGVCIDTCHAFAAGYELGNFDGYQNTIEKLDATVGLQRIKAFHINDSKKPFGSRRDRHEHVGEGEMGLEPFRNLLQDSRFRDIPMYLETPKTDDEGNDADVINLKTLRGLASTP